MTTTMAAKQQQQQQQRRRRHIEMKESALYPLNAFASPAHDFCVMVSQCVCVCVLQVTTEGFEECTSTLLIVSLFSVINSPAAVATSISKDLMNLISLLPQIS